MTLPAFTPHAPLPFSIPPETGIGGLPEITATNVSAAYDDTSLAVGNVSMRFPSRAVTAILGPSGCGKSTFLKTLNRTLELTQGAGLRSGDIRFRGTDIYAPGTDARLIRSMIGMIHQKPVPFPMSIEENVLFGARFHFPLKRAARQALAETYLRQAGLWDEVKDRLRAPAHALSGGQQQRLCLARTLANQPDVILMDEPCSSLDPASTARIEQLILELKARYTVIIVTHNIAQARRVADTAMIMIDGALAEAGAAADILSSPRSRKARDFIQGRIG